MPATKGKQQRDKAEKQLYEVRLANPADESHIRVMQFEARSEKEARRIAERTADDEVMQRQTEAHAKAVAEGQEKGIADAELPELTDFERDEPFEVTAIGLVEVAE